MIEKKNPTAQDRKATVNKSNNSTHELSNVYKIERIAQDKQMWKDVVPHKDVKGTL